MACGQCGGNIAQGARFCKWCGVPQEDTTEIARGKQPMLRQASFIMVVVAVAVIGGAIFKFLLPTSDTALGRSVPSTRAAADARPSHTPSDEGGSAVATQEPRAARHDIETLGPGFDCRAVNIVVEKLICADKELSELDRRLNDIYLFVLNNSPLDGGLASEQLQWLQGVRNRCAERECLAVAYERRLDELFAIGHGK